MEYRKQVSFILLMSICSICSADVAENEKILKAMQLIDVTKVVERKMTIALTSGNHFRTQYDALGLNPQQSNKLDYVIGRRRAEFIKTLQGEAFKRDLAVAYTETYNLAELNSLIEFYSSELGQKLLREQSKIDKKTIAIIQRKLQSAEVRLRPMLQKFDKQIRGR